MQDSTFSRPKPGTPLPRSGHSATLWTGIAALAATAALGIAAPRFAGHANAHAASAATQPAMPMARSASPTSAATWDRSVPAASDVFVNPESGAVITSQSPTF
jgi:hypothetical protein